MDIDDVKANSRKERDPSIGDQVEVFKFPKKKWTNIRLINKGGGIHPTAEYWVKTKKADGSKTKFPVACPSWDPSTQERDSTKYDPWRDYGEAEFQKNGKEGRDKNKIQFGRSNWAQAIIRVIQEDEPKKKPKYTKSESKSGVKEKDSDSWTPIKAIKMPGSFLSQVQELKQLNAVSKKGKGTKNYSMSDERYGRDIRVYYDDTKAPAEQYKVQMGEERTPLTEEEQAYLIQNLEAAVQVKIPSKKEIKADFESWLKRNGLKDMSSADEDEDDEDEDDDDAPKSKKGKGKSSRGKSKKSKDEDNDFDDEDEEDDDEDDEPKSKKGKKSKSKSRDDDDEDDDFDDDDEDDDEEDAPKSKSKKSKKKSEDDDDDDDDEPKSKSKSKKKSKADADDEDDEDDEDSDDDEDDEDEDDDDVKPKKGSKSKSKKSKKSEDDDDFDDEEDEDDDEDEPPKKGKKAGKKSSKKSRDEEDEDDFDDDEDEDSDSDDEEDEDDEDERPKKGKKSKAKSKSKSKKSKSDDDEDDDDFDD